jgi:hypothetical protein
MAERKAESDKGQHVTATVSCLLWAMLLSGCAQYKWQKYGATQSDFNRDTYECQTEAARTYPTQMVTQQITPGYATPSTTNCYGNSAGNGDTYINCTTMPGQYVRGAEMTLDANSGNRSQAANQCMYARGWQLIRVKSSTSHSTSTIDQTCYSDCMATGATDQSCRRQCPN